jgi:hypothetical protein
MPEDSPVWLVSSKGGKRYRRGTRPSTTLKATPTYTLHSSRYLTVTIILPLNAEIDMKKSSEADQNEWIQTNNFSIRTS